MGTVICGRFSTGNDGGQFQTAWLIGCLACLIFILSISAGLAHAKEVMLPYKGLHLNADLDLADGKNIEDGVILITHGALAHRGMELIANLQKLLKARGYSTLAINLSLGLDNRHGMYDCAVTHRHRNEDAAAEIGVWVDWLQKQGAREVVLLGHSRGGAQTALYSSEQGKGPVKAVILLAPATGENTNAAAYQLRYQKSLAAPLKKAQQLIRAGKGGSVLEHVGLLTCNDTSATAASFVSYYMQSPSLDIPSLLPRIRQPTLVLIASSDEVVVGLERKLSPLADGRHMQVKVVDGADHSFRDLYADDAADEIDAFLRGTAYSSRAPCICAGLSQPPEAPRDLSGQPDPWR